MLYEGVWWDVYLQGNIVSEPDLAFSMMLYSTDMLCYRQTLLVEQLSKSPSPYQHLLFRRTGSTVRRRWWGSTSGGLAHSSML